MSEALSGRTVRGMGVAAQDIGAISLQSRPERHDVTIPRAWARGVTFAAGVAASLPIVSSTVRAVRAGWVPAGDDGIIATRGWDVLSSHMPLVGQYSEAGLVVNGQVMHSPGPMLYWLLALPAHLGTPASLAVTMGIVNTLAVIGCVAIARKRGGLALMLVVAAGIAVMCRSLPSEALHDIWNPAAGLFPFLLLVFVCWSLACGELKMLPAAALLASFVVQTHLMYLAPTVALLGIACAGVLIDRFRRDRRAGGGGGRGRAWPWVMAGVAVLTLSWSAPVVQQLGAGRGNLAMIVSTAENRGASVGSTVGWRAVVRATGWRPWWVYRPASAWERKKDLMRASSPTAVDSTIAILAALALLAVVAAVSRRRDLAIAAIIGLLLCGALGAEAAANPSTRLLRETLGYTMWWGSEVGLWVWVTLAWAAWLGLSASVRALAAGASNALRPHLRMPNAGYLLASSASCVGGLVAVLVLAQGSAAGAAKDSHAYAYAPAQSLASSLEGAIPAGRTIAFHLGPLNIATQPTETAIRFLLVRHGDRPLSDGAFPRLGSYYVEGHRPVQWTVYLADGDRRPRGMRLAGRVRFGSPWGVQVLSAWVAETPRAPRTASCRRPVAGGKCG